MENISIFEKIKHVDDNGEFWYARELMKTLEYTKWQKFNNVIENSKESCLNSNNNVDDHFTQVDKMIDLAKNAKRKV